jgi:predicted RNase H-like HicB family nuclease
MDNNYDMKTIVAVIEKSDDGGYGIYCPDLKGVALYGYGLTEQEARENLSENLAAILEHYEEENEPVPDGISGSITFEYRYDFSGFFKAYPIFNVSELGARIGIHPSLMRKYKQGIVPASDRQREKIEAGIHDLARQLSVIRF